MNGISCFNADNGVCKTILASYWKTSDKKLAPGEKYGMTGAMSVHTNTETLIDFSEERIDSEWEKK